MTMKLNIELLGVLVLLAALGASQANTTNAINAVIDVNAYPNSTLEATAWSFIYTYPLAIFANFAGNVLRNVSVNQIFHQRNLATVNDPGVIKPNVDTLYSRVVLDLSKQDVELTVPNISDGRYWNYPVLDVFGNVIAEIGIVNGNRAGKYLIRRVDDVAVAPGFDNSTRRAKNATGSGRDQYQGIVNLPTTYGTMLIRLLLVSNTTADLNAVHAYQNASRLTSINRTVSSWISSPAPYLNTTFVNGTLLGINTPAKQFTFAAKIVADNSPENRTDRYRVATILARAGLYNGQYYPQPGVNVTQAAVIANRSITADVTNATHIRDQGNGWRLSIPSYQGNYGTNYAASAYVALFGYQAQNVRQTLYPGYGSLGFTTTFTLRPNTSVLVTFSRKPVLQKAGFWSLTVYGSDQYLVPNPINRYEVGDRTYNLTYQDGSGFVYGPSANKSHDGPFQVLVQPKDIQPPANWTNNWLPSDTTFSWILRWYTPELAMTNGSYVYPVVQNISAIRA